MPETSPLKLCTLESLNVSVIIIEGNPRA